MPPQAKVTFGEWNWTDSEALYIKQPGNTRVPTIWTDYQIRNRYEGDLSVYMMGNTAPDGFGDNEETVSFVQLSAPTLLWITDWTASRMNAPPTIPDPNPDNNDWVLLDMHMETSQLTVPTDGQSPYYRISGTYFYGHKKPPKNPLGLMCFPRPPWLKDTPNRFIDYTMFEKELNTPKGQKKTPELTNPVILRK